MSAAADEWSALRREAAGILELIGEPADLVWAVGPDELTVAALAGHGEIAYASAGDALTALRDLVGVLRQVAHRGAR